MPTTLRGACHCRNLAVVLETSLDPRALPLRACQCSFCRRHGGITDFLLCRRCGVYVAATMETPEGTLGVLNVNVLDEREPFARPATPMEYGAESVASREDRRAKVWMPVTIRVA